MFTYNVSGKAIENGKVRVTVDYTNGTVNVSVTDFITSLSDLDNKIETKLKELEANVLLEASITVGEYVKAIKEVPEPVPVDPIQEALNAVEQGFRDKERKLITEVEYDALVLNYKTLSAK